MSADDERIFPLGDSALTVTFSDSISIDTNRRAVAFADALTLHSFPGLIEAVPAYSSATVYYDPLVMRESCDEGQTASEYVAERIRTLLDQPFTSAQEPSTTVEIPVNFDARSALDRDEVAQHCSLPFESVIDIFLSSTYRVFMLGFLPGFAYLGILDERIAVPRKQGPRKSVPKGSVGIAGTQTGVYPLESPGGWQIIGRTAAEMFTPDSEPPCLLKPGDTVRFIRE